MRFNVPIEKDLIFSSNLFNLISNNLSDLRGETGKWPDQIAFSGPLGKEVHSFILEKGWDLNKFKPTLSNSIVNQIVFSYSKPITQIEDPGSTIFDDSFNNRQVTGIVGHATMQKIIGKYAAPAFKIERQIRPSIEIELIRNKNV